MTNLEQLLQTPLATIADNGFSKQVIEKIQRYQRIRTMVLTSLYSFVAMMLLLFYPVRQLVTQFVDALIATSQHVNQALFSGESLFTTQFSAIKAILQQPTMMPSLIIITIFSVFFLLHFIQDN